MSSTLLPLFFHHLSHAGSRGTPRSCLSSLKTLSRAQGFFGAVRTGTDFSPGSKFLEKKGDSSHRSCIFARSRNETTFSVFQKFFFFSRQPSLLSSVSPTLSPNQLCHRSYAATPINAPYCTDAPERVGKKLPLGIQTYRNIIEEDYLYVDKTRHALQLIQEEKYYFLSRPRRFGKSLLVSTLQSILTGEKKLFKNQSIYHAQYHWKKHSVVHFDFSAFDTRTTKSLETDLRNKIAKIGLAHGRTLAEVSKPTSSVQEDFVNLIEHLSRKGNVAVLIDEYNKPLVDNIEYLDVAKKNRDFLQGFFGSLKSVDRYLSFVLITGVSTFSHTTLFSGLTNLIDITMDPAYAQLTGYTEEEIKHHFKEHIQAIIRMRSKQGTSLSEEDILAELREWYNGYRFSSSEIPVYNPYSILGFMLRGHVKSYWYETGSPSLLIKQLQKNPFDLLEFSGAKVKQTELLDLTKGDKIRLIPLMFQTGYLTIRDYSPQDQSYTLDFPNKEVQEAFADSLCTTLMELNPADISAQAHNVKKEISLQNFESFFHKLNSYFARIPPYLFKDAKEGFYHAILTTLLYGFGIKTRSEDPTNTGRIDISFELANVIHILECKSGQTADVALWQIEDKKYKEKYSHEGKSLVILGINFSTESRNISEWKGKSFSPKGDLIKEFSFTTQKHSR